MVITVSRNSKLKIIPNLKLANRGYRNQFNTFSFGGKEVDLYVDQNLWVLIASGQSPDGALPIANKIELAANNIISSTVADSIPDIARIRITDVDQNTYDAQTSSSNVIARFKAYKGLSYKGSGNQWELVKAPAGVSLNPSCTGSSNDALSHTIFHACGDGRGLHWMPGTGYSRISWTGANSQNIRLQLWIKGS